MRAESLLTARLTLGQKLTTEDVVRCVLDWAEPRVAPHDLQIKATAEEVSALADLLDRVGYQR